MAPALVAGLGTWLLLWTATPHLPPGLRLHLRGASPQPTAIATPSTPTGPSRHAEALSALLRSQGARAKSTIEIDQRMTVGQFYEATLIIERGDKIWPRTLQITQSTPQPVAVEIPIEVTDQVWAIANGPGLKVEAVSPQWQTLTPGSPAVWSWNLQPGTAGATEVTFTLYQRVRVDGGDEVVFVERYPQKVEVTVDKANGLLSALGAIFKTLGEPINAVSSLAALIAALYGFSRWLRDRRRPPAPASPPQATAPIDPATPAPTSAKVQP